METTINPNPRWKMVEKIQGTSTRLLVETGYCCCGQDQGKRIIATLCPKHGATALNPRGAGALEYPLTGDSRLVHYIATGCVCRQIAGERLDCPVHHPDTCEAELIKELNQQLGLPTSSVTGNWETIQIQIDDVNTDPERDVDDESDRFVEELRKLIAKYNAHKVLRIEATDSSNTIIK